MPRPGEFVEHSSVFLDRTIREVVDATLQRQALGAGLVPSARTPADAPEDDGDSTTYTPFRTTYQWRLVDVSRVMSKEARPYVVQDQEGELGFVSRLLEDEGIAYHFEHSPGELCLVLSDFDRGRAWVPDELPCVPDFLGREVFGWSASAQLRPRSVVVVVDDCVRAELENQAGTLEVAALVIAVAAVSPMMHAS